MKNKLAVPLIFFVVLSAVLATVLGMVITRTNDQTIQQKNQIVETKELKIEASVEKSFANVVISTPRGTSSKIINEFDGDKSNFVSRLTLQKGETVSIAVTLPKTQVNGENGSANCMISEINKTQYDPTIYTQNYTEVGDLVDLLPPASAVCTYTFN